MIGRGIFVHVVLLAAAIGASVFVWTRDKKAPVVTGNVTVWNARSADVDKIGFESKTKKVSLESRKDAQGRWYYGTSDSPATPAADGGAPPAKTATVFVSVTAAEKIADAVAPLKALREVGKIGDDRAAEFGLKEPEGTLDLNIAGKEHKLVVGAHTPGGGDRYVREDGTGIVYVVKGDVTRDIEVGESLMSERELHAFKDADIESVHVTARGKSRDILHRGPEGKRFWADPSDPEKADETVANWISKIDRLKPAEYLMPQPNAPEMVVRLDYKAKGATGAFFEVAKIPATPAPGAPANAPKFDYVVRSERTRLWAKAYGPLGEQVEQDLASILK